MAEIDAETFERMKREVVYCTCVKAPWILPTDHFTRDWKPPVPAEYTYLEYEPSEEQK